MAELRLDQVALRTGGQILQGEAGIVFSRFNIDSRLSQPGELFFALVANRDGHDFVADAACRGARGAVVARNIPPPGADFALVRVADTTLALQQLARSVLVDFPVKVVGITGSIGKTTTKEFTASLLGQKFRVLKSEGNYNNVLGLALTLLKLAPVHEVAVLEMGMSARGEIRTLTKVAPPDLAVITNIHPVHLEFLGSLEEIARAKKEILEGTKPGGWAILNGDDPWVEKISRDWTGPRMTFGLGRRCDVRASRVEKKGFEGFRFELSLPASEQRQEVLFPFFYEDYLYNLLAAIGVSQVLGLSVEPMLQAITRLRPFEHRGVCLELPMAIRLVDDSYNSNPHALHSALRSLADLPARRRVAVLGDMLELGEKEIEFHVQAGRHVVSTGWDVLVTVGPRSLHLAESARRAGLSPERIYSFGSSEEAGRALPSLLQEGDLILVKGSRAVGMELIVESLKSDLKEA